VVGELQVDGVLVEKEDEIIDAFGRDAAAMHEEIAHGPVVEILGEKPEGQQQQDRPQVDAVREGRHDLPVDVRDERVHQGARKHHDFGRVELLLVFGEEAPDDADVFPEIAFLHSFDLYIRKENAEGHFQLRLHLIIKYHPCQDFPARVMKMALLTYWI
jgi:hypothetical protein